MGILYSEIYKNYFPVKSQFTQFTDAEKKTMCRWIKNIEAETDCNNIDQIKRGKKHFMTYTFEDYNAEKLIEMVKKNRIDITCLYSLNCIIYRHKYNILWSIFVFPILTKQHYQKAENKNIR